MAQGLSQYLRGNPESYDVLAALYSCPQGQTFADILSTCDLSCGRLQSLLQRLKWYSLVDAQQPVRRRARVNWRISANSYGAVTALLAQRGEITAENQVTAGA